MVFKKKSDLDSFTFNTAGLILQSSKFIAKSVIDVANLLSEIVLETMSVYGPLT